MNTKHFTWVGASAGALVALALVYSYGTARRLPLQAERAANARAGAERPSPDLSATELARMRGELGGLRAELTELRRAKAEQAAAPAAATDDTEPDPRTLEQQRAESDQQWRDHMAEVALAFDAEPRDGRWARDTTRAVQEVLGRSPGLAAMAGAVECRSATCRVEIERDEAGDVDKQLPIFLNGLTGTLPHMEADHSESNGKSRYTLYLKGPGK